MPRKSASSRLDIDAFLERLHGRIHSDDAAITVSLDSGIVYVDVQGVTGVVIHSDGRIYWRETALAADGTSRTTSVEYELERAERAKVVSWMKTLLDEQRRCDQNIIAGKLAAILGD